MLFRFQVEDMNAFKAYKACVPIAYSPNLYITLVRGIPGTRKQHRRTLEALRLGKCNRTVMRWNTPTVRGMIQQVSTQALSNPSWNDLCPSILTLVNFVIDIGQEVSCCRDRGDVQGPQTEGGKPSSSSSSVGHKPSTCSCWGYLVMFDLFLTIWSSYY